jgi:hypothetical protein
VAQPARSQTSASPPVDPTAVERAYRMERAKRRAKLDRAHERRLARLRFLFVILVLIGATLFFTIVIWQQVTRLFGL